MESVGQVMMCKYCGEFWVEKDLHLIVRFQCGTYRNMYGNWFQSGRCEQIAISRFYQASISNVAAVNQRELELSGGEGI